MNKIKKLRGNMTQKEFAELLDVSERTVQDWEHERRHPDRRSRKAIEKAFGQGVLKE